MTKKMNIGGNPVLDRKPAMKRFNEIVLPVFIKQGYEKMRNSQILYNQSDNKIIIVTSAPSKIEKFNDLKQKIKSFKKSFGNDVKIFLLFTRNYSEWSDKPIYQNTLQRIFKIGNLNGISVGLNDLESLLYNINRGETFYNIQ
jgi:hypothetical protein